MSIKKSIFVSDRLPQMQIRDELQNVLASVDGLLAILVTDKDGVVVVKATRPDLPSRVLEPAFTASFLLTSEQTAKIGFGKAKRIISTWERYCISQFATSGQALTLTLIANRDADMAVVLETGDGLRPAIEAISARVLNISA